MRILKTNYGGQIFDDIIPGFTTVNVEGRGIYTPSLSTMKVSGRDGDIIQEQRIPSRDLVVTFLLKAENAHEYIDRQVLLNHCLKTEKDVEVFFTDRGDEHWVGRASQCKAPPMDSRQGIGSFTIHCSDPFRHIEDAISSDGILEGDSFSNAYRLQVKETKFSATSTSGVAFLNVSNGKRIAFQTLPNIGTIMITPEAITLNGENIVPYIDYQVSTWKGFQVSYGDTLQVKNGTDATYKIGRLLL